ncbi:MAG: hypothetical protein H0W62_12840 [Chitinophagales bacterium]|nr:hypothetical protein [Chitinophagales bacterium]
MNSRNASILKNYRIVIHFINRRSNLLTAFLIRSFFFSALFFACKNQKPDISNIQINLKLLRFDKDLFAIDTSNYKYRIDSLQIKYPVLFPFYFEQLIGWKVNENSSLNVKDSILHYVMHPYSQALYDSSMRRYNDLSFLQKQLQTAFKYYKYYFPDAKIPVIALVINAPPAFTIGDDLICISTDKYLGPDFPLYQNEADPIPQYLLRRFRSEYMASNAIEVFLTGNYEPSNASKALLDAMLYKGKILYLKQKLMTGVPDSIITGFSAGNLKWLNENEKEIWKFFISKKLLYSQDALEYEKYVSEGPNTSGMPPEAPGNIGSWLGWRIISKYMRENSSIELNQLMAEQDAQKILTASKYKPLK